MKRAAPMNRAAPMERAAMTGVAAFDRRPRALVATALLALALTVPAPAQGYDLLRLSGGIGNHWVWTDSLDAIQGGNGLLTGDLRFGVGVWEGLSIELGYRHGSVVDETFAGTVSTELSLHAVDLAARYDLPLVTWLSLYGRAGATYAYARAELSTAYTKIAGDEWQPGLFAAAGIEARLPRRWFGGEDDAATGGRGFTFGWSFEVGYLWQAPFELGSSGQVTHATSEVTGIGSSSVGLGALSLHGLTFRLATSLHY